MLENYSPEIRKALAAHKIAAGDRISVERDGKRYEGLLMPKSAGDPNVIVLKLDSGYNAGVSFAGAKIEKIKGKDEKAKKAILGKYKPDTGKPTIVLLHTGGTIASKVDYRTGAAYPAFTPEELFFAVPELQEIANFSTRVIFQMYSEDMEPEHWIVLAEKIAQEIQEANPDGVIITHGTDTMAYTAAALSLMLQHLPIPVLLVGAQRSSDRGSSDAAMNLRCAAQFIAQTDSAGVALCMHGSMDDEYCFVLPGLHVKKMHTSRRDAFRSIDVLPYAKVHLDGEIEMLRSDYPKKDKAKKLHVVNRFDKRVAIVKIRPGINAKELEAYEQLGYRGLVLEGTGLGNAPVTVLDQHTAHHKELLTVLERMTKRGIIVAMTSQCAYGTVNMNVYSPGRDLLKAGVIPLAMTSEAAFIKLGWALGHTKDSEEAKKILLENVAGEFTERVDPRAFLY
ncbi:MAG: Glu-tRNA(Gln) amidotransferase subunit GatD [Candidatus Aenigmarchaeota archaeon]|nr:Glu-tRNA(Gln) amidotransferase subunit GatD [Candidatus Aenigmarchaeota archaeon]